MEEFPLNQSAFQRAKTITKSVFHSIWFYLFQTCFGAVLTAFVLLSPLITDIEENGIRILWQVLIPLFGVFLGLIIIFIFNLLFRAPYKQRNEARNKVKELLKVSIPCIKIKRITGRRKADYERTEHEMWAELRVTNISTKELIDVQVNITECLTLQKKPNSVNQNEFDMWDFLKLEPFSVYWSERQAQSKQMSLVIPKGTARSALIAFQDNSNGRSFSFNSLQHKLVVGGVKISVEISNHEAVLWSGDFYLECHPNYYHGPRAEFEFVEWEKWTKDKNITSLDVDK